MKEPDEQVLYQKVEKGDTLACRLFYCLFRAWLQRETTAYQHKEQRHEVNRQNGGGDHSPHYASTHRMLTTGTGTAADCHRQYAEDKRQRGHQYRA